MWNLQICFAVGMVVLVNKILRNNTLTALTHSLDIPPRSIATASVKWCKGWWKICCKKVPKGTRVAVLRAQIREWQLTLRNTGRLQIETGLQLSSLADSKCS